MQWTSALLLALSLNAQAADYKSKIPIPSIRPAGTGLNFVGNLVGKGYFFAQGTWTTTDLSDEAKMVAFPINLSEVVCNRSGHECLVTGLASIKASREGPQLSLDPQCGFVSGGVADQLRDPRLLRLAGSPRAPRTRSRREPVSDCAA